MRKISLMLVSLFCSLFAAQAQGVLPEFSTEDAPVWYYIQFKAGKGILSDEGAGNTMKTATAVANTVGATQYALIGTKDNFYLKCRTGRFVNFVDGAYKTSTTDKVWLKLITHNADAAYWEIQRPASGQCMNQFQGSGIGRELHEWYANDVNNPVQFVSEMPRPIPDVFSYEDNPTYYLVQFHKGGGVLSDKGNNAKLLTANVSKDDANQWMFVGAPGNFYMKSKEGNYVNYVGDAFTASSATSVPMKIVATGNGEAEGCWELQRVAADNKSMNQHQGSGIGRELHEWNANDINNPVRLVIARPVAPLFSVVDGEENWYFVKFINKNTYLSGNGMKGVAFDHINANVWKFVGDINNFQLVNKDGAYAGINGNKLQIQNKAYGPGFKFVETTATNYPYKYVIASNDASLSSGVVVGTNAGNAVTLGSKSSADAPVEFVAEDDIVHADFAYVGVDGFTPVNALTLWYNEPATVTGVDNIWMEYSLPIGNGQLGACLFGGIWKDEIQFNEKTLWTGTANDYGGYGQYKNFGSIFVEDISGVIGFGSNNPAKDYVRYLDIEEGVAGVRYSNADGTTNYERTYFVSEPDQIFAARYTANGADKLSLKFSYAPGEGINASAVTYADGQATFSGKLTTVSYNTRFNVVPVGNEVKMTETEEGIVVENADEVLLIMTAGTDYDITSKTFVSGTSELPTIMEERVNDAAQKGWNKLYADHVVNFKSYTGRVKLTFDDAAVPTVPTNQLVDDYSDKSKHVTGKESHVLFLEQLYFHYGRYLLISSSRGIDVPNNLQGIWNDKSNAPWNSDIHTNINIQMNYWPAEPTNLSELHEPLLNHIITLAAGDNWQRMAREKAGVKHGWTVFTESNIFGGMGTFGSNYFVANVWYCSHLWQHYRYTLNKDYLLRAFPAMWSCAQFWFERMIKDRVVNDGTYVAPDEYSPEQDWHPREDATAHAQQMVYMHFVYTKQAIEVLGQETCGLTDEDIAMLDDYIANTDQGLHIEKFKGGDWTDWGKQWGIKQGDELMREWKYSDYDVSPDKGHRHISHLMCLYPYNQISPNSPYFKPAVNSLKLRGDAATGWSMGWKVNLWARALDGDHAHVIIKNALKHSTSYGTNQSAGGIYYNLWDSHAPFQIDGNFGVCSGIAEMLMQSHTDTIQVLPALTSTWENGSVTGLKAVGDFTIDIYWKAGVLEFVRVTSNQGQPLVINYPGIAGKKVTINNEEVTYTTIDENNIEVKATKGDVVKVFYNPLFDGIESVQTTKKTSKIYQLDGREVSKMQPNTIYIVDGKKVVNK